MMDSFFPFRSVGLFFLFAFLLFPHAAHASQMKAASQRQWDYRLTPGVTSGEIAAIEALKARYTRFVYAVGSASDAFVNAEGKPVGFAPLFCAWLTEYLGIPCEVEYMRLKESQKKIAAKSLDFTGDFQKSPENLKKLHMTGPLTERPLQMYRLPKSPPLEEIARSRSVRYIFMEQSSVVGKVREVSPFPFESSIARGREDVLPRLRNGEADALLVEGPQGNVLTQAPDLMCEEFIPHIYSHMSLATPKDELAPIISVVQKFMKSEDAYIIGNMLEQGTQEYKRNNLLSRLDATEQAYIDEHIATGAPIPVLAEAQDYPLSFYDHNTGQWQGIAIDLLQAISSLTGLKFAPVDEKTGDDALHLAMLEEGKAAMHTLLVKDKAKAERFLWANHSYGKDNFALLSLGERESVTLAGVRYMTVGIVRDTLFEDIFFSWYPEHDHVRLYPDDDAAFAALEQGEIELFMTNSNKLLYVTNYLENSRFKANLLFKQSQEATFGFGKDQYVLRSIISKALPFVDTEAVSYHWTRKVFDHRSKLAKHTFPYLIAFVAILLLALFQMYLLFIKTKRFGKQLEIEVRERTKDLHVQTTAAQVASRAKSAFLARMSHELRTPLNAIVGMAAIAEKAATEPDNSKRIEDVSRQILASAGHLSGILTDVLDMANIESGKCVLEHAPFSIKSAFLEVEHMLAPKCAEAKLTLFTDMGGLSDTRVEGDKLRLKQVLINVLGNAVKFTPKDGSVRFRASVLSEDEHTLSVRFAVSDTGIGMPEEQLNRLFTPFEQADASIAEKFGGAGLGLAISRNLVEQMGGTLHVQSALGRGTHITFSLAFQKSEPEAAQQESKEVPVPDLSGKHIMIVEDTPINRIILLELLEDTHAAFTEAEDGVQATELFANSEPGYYDLIITDIQMPNMNGYETAKKIRAMNRPDAADVPIVAMSANAYREDVEMSLEAGMNEHLAKPVDLNAVRKILAKYLLNASRPQTWSSERLPQGSGKVKSPGSA